MQTCPVRRWLALTRQERTNHEKDHFFLLSGSFRRFSDFPGKRGPVYDYPDSWTQSLEVRQAYHDDDEDEDQAFSENRVNYIKVINSARRYVGVYIERVYPVPVAKIDNGSNDELIIAREELISYDAFKCLVAEGFGTCDGAGAREEYMDRVRHYVLPVPDDLAPGEEVRFRVKVLGPGAWTKDVPDLDPNSDSNEAKLFKNATDYTAFTIFGSKLFKVIAEGCLNQKAIEDQIFKDFQDYMASAPKYRTMWQQGQFESLFEDNLKFFLQSDILHHILKRKENLQYLTDIRGSLNLPLINITDMVEGFLHIIDANVEDVFAVTIVRPKIDNLVPAKGAAGDSIVIRGKGFYSEGASDEDKNMFTDIYFTTLNDNRVPVTILKAESFTVVNENEIRVTVPEGFYPGPVQVCVDGLCSNEVSFADEFETSVNITAPEDGDLLSAITTLAAELVDPPDDFPEYPATATFFIDGKKIMDKPVQSMQFTFTIDIDPLEDGVHTARVEVAFPGHTVGDSITFSKGFKALDLSNVKRVKVEFLTKNPYQYTNPAEGDKVTEKGVDERETERNFNAPGKFEKNRYYAEWHDIGYGNVEVGGFISATFNPAHDIITEISFHRYERDKDPGSSYYLEEIFQASSKPSGGDFTDDANMVYVGESFGGHCFGSFKNDVCRIINAYSDEQQKNPTVKRTEEKGTCEDSSYLRIILFDN